MAPIFDVPSPARAKAPAFSFNAHSRTSSQSNGLFRPKQQQSPIVNNTTKHHNRGSSDGSWDNMNDDFGGDGQSDIEDSRAFSSRVEDTMMEGEDLTRYESEISQFAFELDNSVIDQDDDGELVNRAGSGFQLVQRFQNLATQEVERCRKLQENGDGDAEEVQQELKHWELEHQTWELFSRLAEHRMRETTGPLAIPDTLARNRYLSNKHIRDYLYENHPKFRELWLVLDWLQVYAPMPVEELVARDGQLKADAGWMYTREKIKGEKRRGKQPAFSLGFGHKGKENGVKTLDPDAPTREQKRLESEDEVADRLLMKTVWRLLRRGDIPAAQELCEESGEWWRAASLSGGEESWDEAIDGPRAQDGDETMDGLGPLVKGNKRRELWKRMCYALARRPEVDTYEKAVYGALCGDIESVVPACETWEDYLFVHFNSLVEGYYTSTLASASRIPPAVASFPTFDSIAYHSFSSSLHEDSTVIPRIIDSVSAQCKSVPEAQDPMRILQGALISNRLTDKISELDRQYQLLRNEPDCDLDNEIEISLMDVRLLRVLVHIILSLDSINAGPTPGSPDHEKAETVIGAYISILGELGKFELMPLYAKRLTPEKATKVIGSEMIKVPGECRQDLHGMMSIHGVDFDACLRSTMELAFSAAEPLWFDYKFDRKTIEDGFEGEVLEVEDQLISALEWLVLSGDSLRGDAIIAASEIYKKLLLSGRLPACKALYEHTKSEDLIPPNSDNTTTADNDDVMSDSSALGNSWQTPQTQAAAAVFIDLEDLVIALLALDEWNQKLKELPSGRIDRETRDSLKKIYDDAAVQLQEVLESLLVGEDMQKLEDVTTLRRLYVPELVLALHRLHTQAAQLVKKDYLAKTMELAVLVADPEKNVLECFEAEGEQRLREYVQELASASRGMLGVVQDGARCGNEMRVWGVEA